jgi:Tfp pilus assembly protein PilW
MTLVEVLVASGLSTIVLTAIATFTVFSARSFVSMSNYCDLDNKSLYALDVISRDIRQADALTSFTTNTLVFQATDPLTGVARPLTYTYSANAQTLTRTLNSESKVLLTGCTYYNHGVYQRNTTNGTYDNFPVDDPSRPDLAKVIQVSWITSRSILGRTANTEDMQSAKFVIRKK